MFWLSASSPNHALLESSSMSSWPIRPHTVLRVILALISIVFPLLAIAFGGMDLLSWIRYYRGNQYYYVEYWPLKHARWFLLVGMIGMLPGVRVLFQRQARLRWLWLSILVPLFLIWYPNFIAYGGHGSINPHDTARYQVRQQLSYIAFQVKKPTEPGRPWHCVSGPTTTRSPYSLAGERLFYQQVCVAADRPTASLLASSAPGTIYIGTGPDEQVVWLRATVLLRNPSNTVRWLPDRRGEPLVLTHDRSFVEMRSKSPRTESRSFRNARPSEVDMRDAAPDHHDPIARSSTSSGSSRGASAETR